MRVMHIISGLTNGGAEAVLYRLVTRDKVDTHCVVSMMDGGHYGQRLRTAGIEVIELGMPKGRLSGAGLKRLRRELRRWQPDTVQTWMYHADLIGGAMARLFSSARVVWGIHHTTHDAKRDSRTKRWIAALCARGSHLIPHRVISCSEEGVRVHEARGYRADRLVAVHNGYDVSEFAPKPPARKRVRRELGITPDTVLFGMVGRYDPQKDHATLIAAFEQLATRNGSGWQALLVGPGVDDRNATLHALVAQAGLGERVRLLGPRDDIPAFMNALDVHVLSSAFGEACPNVIAEAMACGTPCVTTDVGDSALMVKECGWVVPPSDSAALADALQQTIAARQDKTAWKSRQQRGTERIADRFSLQRMIERYRTVWRDEPLPP